MERYAQQALIAGWEQARLTDTRVLVVGHGMLARLVSLLAAAMGFGQIVLMGDGRIAPADQRFLLAGAPEGASVVRCWAEALRRINPEVIVEHVHDGPCEGSVGSILPPDVVVDASTDLGWKARVFRLAGGMDASLILCAAGPRVGFYRVGKLLSRDLLAFHRVREDPLVSLALAALVVEEIRRLRMPLGSDDRVAEGSVLVSPEALHCGAGGGPGGSALPEDLVSVSMVGAGALGTWAGIGLGLAASGPLALTVYDPDGIEATHLNRQVLFYDRLHAPRAAVLAQRLSGMFPNLEAEGKVEAATEANLDAVCGADLVLCGPDTFGTRALLHRAALHRGTPLVNGSTSAFGGDVAVYVPGVSPCLACSLRIDRVARAVAEDEERARCAGVAEASVVTSNALIGALMAYETRAALRGCPARGVMAYEARTTGRWLGVRGVREPCTCHRNARAARAA